MSSTTALWNVLYRHDVSNDLEALPAGFPVTFIHGTEDVTAPLEPIKGCADTRPTWRLIELRGVDHHPWLRRPAACAALLADVLVSIDEARPASTFQPAPRSARVGWARGSRAFARAGGHRRNPRSDLRYGNDTNDIQDGRSEEDEKPSGDLEGYLPTTDRGGR